MNKLRTWMQLLSQIKVTGAVAFSSKVLSRQMLNNVNFENADTIIELGAGCGCITKNIARQKKKSCVFLIFEINKLFCEILEEKIKGENIHIINDSAENMEFYLKKYAGKSTADFVISSLPLTILSQKVKENIFLSLKHVMNHHSSYIQYGYSKERYKKLLHEFKTLNTSFVLINIPPAYVFNCKIEVANQQPRKLIKTPDLQIYNT